MPQVMKPPDQRRRRNRIPGSRMLPAEGRRGRVPAWPMGKASADERRLWGQAWHWPQAVAWEAMGGGVGRTVARYVQLAALTDPARPASYHREQRALEDALGLSPIAMARLGWSVAEVPPGEARRRQRPPRQRMRAIDPALIEHDGR